MPESLSQGVQEIKDKMGVPDETPPEPAPELAPVEVPPEPEAEPVPEPAEQPPEGEPAPEETPPPEPEAELPEWAKEEDGTPVFKNDKEYEVANYLSGGEKPEWYTKGYDKFSEEEKSAFGNMHSIHDKWKQNKEPEAPESSPPAAPNESLEWAEKRLEQMRVDDPDFYKELQRKAGIETQPLPEKAPEFDMNALKKNYADAVISEDEDKISTAYDAMNNAMSTSIKTDMRNEMKEMLVKHDKVQAEEAGEKEWSNQIKTWNDEINEIRNSGDRRIDEYTEIGPDNTHTIARLLTMGDTISGFKPKTVYEAYRFLLTGGKNGDRNGSALKRPDFGAMSPPQGNFNEGEVQPDQSNIKSKSTREWMEAWPGFNK